MHKQSLKGTLFNFTEYTLSLPFTFCSNYNLVGNSKAKLKNDFNSRKIVSYFKT